MMKQFRTALTATYTAIFFGWMLIPLPQEWGGCAGRDG